jgi:hypothetical protein
MKNAIIGIKTIRNVAKAIRRIFLTSFLSILSNFYAPHRKIVIMKKIKRPEISQL